MSATWQRLEDSFFELLELPEGARGAKLAEIRGRDPELELELRGLLERDARTNSWLDEAIEKARSDSRELEHAPWLEGGKRQRAGPYRLIKELGRGGLGTVFLGERHDGNFHQRVAVKLINRGMDTDQVIRRLRQERQILASLNHPNIARLLDGGTTEDGLPFLVMELVEGEGFLDYCDGRELSLEQRLRLFVKVCAGVEFAHRSLVIHRDLKSSNILVTREGEPKLVDFGIAKLLDSSSARGSHLMTTLPGFRVLSPDCASPEQVRGAALTTATDVYSLGVLLCRLLTGHGPSRLEALTVAALEKTICETPPSRPSALALAATAPPPGTAPTPEALTRRLRGDLDAIALKALRKEPDERYSSVERLAQDVSRHLDSEPVRARRGATAYRLSRFVRRHRWAVAVGGLVAVSLLATTGLALHQRDLAVEAAAETRAAIEVYDAIFVEAPPGESLDDTTTMREVLDSQVQRVLRYQCPPRVKAFVARRGARAQFNAARFKQATNLAQVSAELFRSAGDRSELAVSLELLGEAALADGQYPLASRALTESLELVAGSSAAGRQTRARLLNSRGSLAIRNRDYLQASRLLGEAKSLVGEEGYPSHLLADILENQAASLRRQKNLLDEAEQMQRRALTVRSFAGGRRHPRTSETQGRLASLLLERNKLEEAETLFLEALQIQRAHRVAYHPELITTWLNYLGVLRKTGRVAEARVEYEQILETLEGQPERRHGLISDIKNQLADLLRRGAHPDDFEKAEGLYLESLELRRKHFKPDDPRIANPMLGLGRLYLSADRPGLAEPFLRAAVEIYEQAPDGHRLEYPYALRDWGQSLMRIGRPAEAAEILSRSLKLLGSDRDSRRAARVRRLLESARQQSEDS